MSWRPRWRRPPGGVRGSATKVPTHLSNTGQQAQRSCVSAGRCAHRGANRWAIKKTFHTAKRETGLEHYQARHGYQQLRYGRDRTHSDSPGGRLPQKVATTGVSHGHAFPSRFSVTASKQQTRNHGAYHPKGFHPQKRCTTNHQSPITQPSVTTTCTAPLKRSLLKWPPLGDRCDSWCAHTHRHRISTVRHSRAR